MIRKCIALLGAGGLLAALPTLAQRQQLLFNADWKFHLGDVPGSEQPRAADKAWHTMLCKLGMTGGSLQVRQLLRGK